MTKHINWLSTIAALVFTITACKKEVHGPLEGGGGTPQPVSNLSVENLPGAAKITYTLPGKQNILYVEATYTIRPGETRTEKSSLYNNFVYLEGFADTLVHPVTLKVVGKSGEASEGVTVDVEPLLPPYIAVYRSLQVIEDFGGINIAFDNEYEADIAIVTCTDTLDDFEAVDKYYTSKKNGNYSLRGYDSVERQFGVYIKDRWGNISDTLTALYKPLYEKMLDKSLFKKLSLPTDVADEDNWGDMSLPRMWDGSYNGWDMWHSKPEGFPMWMTIDLGVTAQLSRMTLWQRQDDPSYLYAQNNVKHFQVYGSNSPNPDGSWDDSWTLLFDYTLTKPSGLPLGQVSQDDIDAAKVGEQISLPPGTASVRYIRFKILETWQTGGTAANIAEISLWGQL